MAYGDLKVRNLIWNTGSGDNTVVLSTLATQSYVTTNFAPKSAPTFTGTINGADLILSGNLTVSGTQTIINTSVLDVEDINITLGKVSSPSDTTANNGGITLKGSTDKTFNWLNATDSWTSSEHIEIASGKNLKVDGTTFFVDGTNNRVGIGITSPGTELDVIGTARANNFVLRTNGSAPTADASIFRAADNTLAFATANTERMRINSSGRVGIGTTSPTNHLHVNAGATNTAAVFESTDTEVGIQLKDTTGSSVIKARNDFRFDNSTGELMRIDSSGNVGIGLTSPTSTTKLHIATVQSGGAAGTGMTLSGWNGSAESRVQFMSYGIGDGTLAIRIGTSNTERLRVGSAGQIGISGANYGTSGQVLTSGGASAAPSWADAGGGAWEVVYTKLLSGSLPTTGGYAYVENKGWSNSYARYKVTFDGINRESPGGGQQVFKLWIDFYKDSSNIIAGAAYKAKGANIGGSNFTNGDSTKWGPCNDANAYRMSGDVTIPMFNSGSEDINKHAWATWMLDDELYMERVYYDANNSVSSDHFAGMRIRFVHGNNDLNGRITFLRQKYS